MAQISDARGGRLPSAAEEQILDESSRPEHQDDDEQKPDQAHAPHHPAAYII
jgi:hypothetical protein